LGRKEICVLGLHRVLTEEEYPRSFSLDGIKLREETFVTLLKHLEQSFQVLPIDAVVQADAGDPRDSRPICVLTFDDGWRDNYTTAFPWLKKLGLPATIFLVTGLVGSGDTFWIERLATVWADRSRRAFIQSESGGVKNRSRNVSFEKIIEHLKHMPAAKRQTLLSRMLPAVDAGTPQSPYEKMMDWNQVIEMSQNGIEFGAHTVTHPLLPQEDDSAVQNELHSSRLTLEKLLGKKARSFAYPNGEWDERVRSWVARAGYECAFTTRSGWHCVGDDPFTIRRVLLHEGNITGMDGKFSPAVFNYTLARRD
jgi:peptidoglycan/xylan/chitin deacetylase (PgdA/CDA1 family)